ncbi:Stp1/IreP family PP2C-type Ser/Thr phosphatase [Viridibacillus sp. YIM B01967]|uniref:Stp1/IreP family PP2C-type Ser/Thr phosphatase n=1 Tax=Viridibacillus soli TaxID=2798301 RepID=A0ABS1H561_9BACL|nr:Stp1/IreP family PP2C-type Ser/Thr phosphatase [Viridibacillus soli]MBK3494436.1 Stp1/IreP family PP2C-type Ser/Thr phosphatase [Viridibacillus soli]
MEYIVASDIGRKRTVNEDRAKFIERQDSYKLAIVADGMGGHNAGDIASDMAVTEFERLFLQADAEQFQTVELKREWLVTSVQELNASIYQYSLSHEDCHGMGTTLIAVLIDDSECTICHVGDSRVYFSTATNLQLITRDHSYVNILVDSGEISEEEAESHPKKNYIIKSLGTEATIAPDLYMVQFVAGSYLLVCSDGLSNKLTTQEMQIIIHLPLPIQDKGEQLIQLANELGGEDNISLILFANDMKEV